MRKSKEACTKLKGTTSTPTNNMQRTGVGNGNNTDHMAKSSSYNK